jgi:CBS domain-containing protein
LTGIELLRIQTIESLLETRPLFSEDERVSKAIGFLREIDGHEVFVARERRIAGVTTRDLLSVSDPLNTKLAGLLYSLPEITAASNMAEAARLMFDYRLWALPGRWSDGSVQVLTAKSMMRAMKQCTNLQGRASEVMAAAPVAVQADDTVLKAKSLMTRRSLDHLVVMKGGQIDGILTSSDILFELLPEERMPERGRAEVRFDYPVSRIAKPPLLVVEPSAPIADVVEAMLKHQSSYAVVKLWDEVQGIITYREAMKPLLAEARTESPFYIVGVPGDPFEAEAAKMKLQRLGDMLTKAMPSIKEIRAVVKSRETAKGRPRYEVSFDIYAPSLLHAYVEEGYDLSEIFDRVGPRLKRILGAKQSKVTRSMGDSRRKVDLDQPE